MYRRLNRYISILYRYGQRYFAHYLHPLGLEPGQAPSLFRVLDCPGVSQDEIATELCIDKGAVARSVQQLEQNGLVARHADPSDRRVNRIYPTMRARELEPQIIEVAEGLQQALYAGFSPEEIQKASELLSRMQQNMRDYMDRVENGEQD